MQWQDVLTDKSLQNLPYKIELNEWGNIEMSPASFIHSLLQGKIARLLGNQLDGEVFTELAIQTSHGIRVPDVAWASQQYVQQHIKEVYASSAPEICIEIISPANSPQEMQNKIKLFLEAGAHEVWLVNENGTIDYYNPSGQIQSSEYKITIDSLL